MNHRNLFIFLCLLSTWFTPNAIAQTVSEKVDAYVERALLERHIPGISLAVIRDGVPIKVKGYGWSDIENKVPVHPETIFQSGSIGKQFTAAAILQLEEEGKLKLDDKIATYFSGTPVSWRNITIRNLLTHTSGIPDYESANLLDLRKDYTEQELLQFAIKMPLAFGPGEKWAYSNTAYVLLGVLIRQLTGRFYGEVLQEKLFTPLSMETARVITEPDIVLHRSSGYELQNGEWKNQSWVAPSLNSTADGSIYLSILDFVKWDAALTKATFLNPQHAHAMVTPVKLNDGSLYPYGFGWFLTPVNGHKSFQHSGSWQGYNSYIAKFPDDKLTIIVLTNLNPSNPGLIANDIAALYIPELSRPIVKAVKDSNAALTGFITQLFQNPNGVDLNNQVISKEALQNMKAVVNSNNLFLKTFGKVQTVQPLETSGTDHNKYLVTYKVGSRLATVTNNKSGEIIKVVSEAY